MSLGKLLATGRSLVGGAPDEGRYNISSRNRLPKFGSAKNPFAPSATSEARVANAPQVEMARAATPPNSEMVNERIAAFVRETEIVCEPQPETTAAPVQSVQHDDTQRIPELADQPFGRVGTAGKTFAADVVWPNRLKAGLRTGAQLAMAGWEKILSFVRGIKWGAALTALGGQVRRAGPLGRSAWAKVKFISTKLAGVFRKSEPKSAIPRFGKSAEQTLLSLEGVKVVRNSLEDSDLEIVTAETRTSTVVAPRTSVASAKRGPVPPALKKMTERLLGVPAQD